MSMAGLRGPVRSDWFASQGNWVGFAAAAGLVSAERGGRALCFILVASVPLGGVLWTEEVELECSDRPAKDCSNGLTSRSNLEGWGRMGGRRGWSAERCELRTIAWCCCSPSSLTSSILISVCGMLFDLSRISRAVLECREEEDEGRGAGRVSLGKVGGMLAHG